jgi:hypothetical protein
LLSSPPGIFELPFNLIVMTRTYPAVPPDPALYRVPIFAPLFLVEFTTLALLARSPLVRLSRTAFTAFALMAADLRGLGALRTRLPLRAAALRVQRSVENRGVRRRAQPVLLPARPGPHAGASVGGCGRLPGTQGAVARSGIRPRHGPPMTTVRFRRLAPQGPLAAPAAGSSAEGTPTRAGEPAWPPRRPSLMFGAAVAWRDPRVRQNQPIGGADGGTGQRVVPSRTGRDIRDQPRRRVRARLRLRAPNFQKRARPPAHHGASSPADSASGSLWACRPRAGRRDRLPHAVRIIRASPELAGTASASGLNPSDSYWKPSGTHHGRDPGERIVAILHKGADLTRDDAARMRAVGRLRETPRCAASSAMSRSGPRPTVLARALGQNPLKGRRWLPDARPSHPSAGHKRRSGPVCGTWTSAPPQRFPR